MPVVIGTGINRNIVECKDSKHLHPETAFPVLIETLWNVKIGDLGAGATNVEVLIETLWNVKLNNSLL